MSSWWARSRGIWCCGWTACPTRVLRRSRWSVSSATISAGAVPGHRPGLIVNGPADMPAAGRFPVAPRARTPVAGSPATDAVARISRTKSWCRPAGTTLSRKSSPSRSDLASAAPVQRIQRSPVRASHRPASSCRTWCIERWPCPARTCIRTRTRASPSIASTRRRITAWCSAPGNASASRHSMTVWSVVQRLRQIRSCPARASRGP